jgi:hypothetical protein
MKLHQKLFLVYIIIVTISLVTISIVVRFMLSSDQHDQHDQHHHGIQGFTLVDNTYYNNNPSHIINSSHTFLITAKVYENVRVYALTSSWLQHVDSFTLFSDKPHSNIVTVPLTYKVPIKLAKIADQFRSKEQKDKNYTDQWTQAQIRFIQSLLYAYIHLPNREWYILIDDDTFLHLHALSLMLQEYNINVPQYIIPYAFNPAKLSYWGGSGHYINWKFLELLNQTYDQCEYFYVSDKSDHSLPKCARDIIKVLVKDNSKYYFGKEFNIIQNLQEYIKNPTT